MKRGDEILVKATVDAFRTGLNSGSRIRVKIGDVVLWVPEEDTVTPEEEINEKELTEYITEELEKRLAIPSTDHLTGDLSECYNDNSEGGTDNEKQLSTTEQTA